MAVMLVLFDREGGLVKSKYSQSVFKQLLEQLGKLLPKEAAKKSIPYLGAIIGGLGDSYCMNRVLKGANLIYHKRFLMEKEKRISTMMDTRRSSKKDNLLDLDDMM